MKNRGQQKRLDKALYIIQKYGLEAKTFIEISFDDSTGTEYTTWLSNINFLIWDLKRKESE